MAGSENSEPNSFFQPLEDTMSRRADAKFPSPFAIAFALGARLWCLPGAARVQRNFPPTALRGELAVGTPPLVSLNGDASQLATGVRICAQNNMLQRSGSRESGKLFVNYTLDMSDQIRHPDHCSLPLPHSKTPRSAVMPMFGT